MMLALFRGPSLMYDPAIPEADVMMHDGLRIHYHCMIHFFLTFECFNCLICSTWRSICCGHKINTTFFSFLTRNLFVQPVKPVMHILTRFSFATAITHRTSNSLCYTLRTLDCDSWHNEGTNTPDPRHKPPQAAIIFIKRYLPGPLGSCRLLSPFWLLDEKDYLVCDWSVAILRSL